MRKAFLGASAVLLVAIGIYALNYCIPFNLTYVKQVKAQHLRDNVKEWKMLGEPASYGHTNETDTSYVWRTNLTVASAPISAVMRLDSALLRGRGYLLVTENQKVFWVGQDGHVKPLDEK
jgi:hypothetical protein